MLGYYAPVLVPATLLPLCPTPGNKVSIAIEGITAGIGNLTIFMMLAVNFNFPDVGLISVVTRPITCEVGLCAGPP